VLVKIVGRELWGVSASGYGISFLVNEHALKVVMVMTVQLCEYIKSH
jgi:hypothetical protein